MRLNRRVDALAGMGDDVRKDYQQARMAEAVEAGDVDVVDLADVPVRAGAHRLGREAGPGPGARAAARADAGVPARGAQHLDPPAGGPRGRAAPARAGGHSAHHRRRRRRSRRASRPARRAARPQADAGSPMSGNQTFSIGIEAFRNLRTSLIWSDGGEALKTLVVTSAAPGEGKTLTAANLAVTLAYDGLRVLLVDCDIRRPAGPRHVPRAPRARAHGAADHDRRAGQSAAPQAIRETAIAGLSVLTCGALPSNAANLLSGTRMRVLLQELREQFDMIVLDTPAGARHGRRRHRRLADRWRAARRARRHHRPERGPAGLPAARPTSAPEWSAPC